MVVISLLVSAVGAHTERIALYDGRSRSLAEQ